MGADQPGEIATKAQNDQPAEESSYLKGWRLAIVITSLFLGAFLIALDTNIVGTAIPKISTEFDALQDISWYGSAYLLTITAFQPMLGNFYRFFAVEATYKGCIVVFESKFTGASFFSLLLTGLSWHHRLRRSRKLGDVHFGSSYRRLGRGRNIARCTEHHRLRGRA